MLLLRTFFLLACAAVVLAATPARAQWLRAESERFIVYSDGGERPLREFTQKLEVFDRLLRARMGLSVEEVPYRKLPIYLVRNQSALRRINPAISRDTLGFYSASNEDIFAVALIERNNDMGEHTLLHEYAHHFMMQNFPFPYPAWFVEGFAEYYMTTKIEGNRIELGNYNSNRASWILGGSWMSLSDLLSSRPGSSVRNPEMFYPQAWLLTHWFMGNTDRQRMLDAYLRDVGSGGDSIEAIQRATGMSLAELRRALRSYRSLPRIGLNHAFPATEVAVTRLPDSANDLLLLNQRLKIGVPADMRPAVAVDARRAAERHGDDPMALLVLGHGELHFGDKDKGRAALNRLLEVAPQHVEAMQFLASDHLDRARELEDADEAQQQIAAARRLLARAYSLDELNYITMLLLSELRMGDAGWPNANDVTTMEVAYTLAPQLAETRLNLGSALISLNRNDDAILLLAPLANAPHGGGAAEAARSMINRARGVTDQQADEEEDALAAQHRQDEDGEQDGGETLSPPAA
ncbi:hypothetical protein E4M02_00375 [Brevundimonas sp. S30B]|uniref:tetratricopeptide repeat protein n=1 Tax=unclassified Brevundimonas TaxID=2622653 RepID=UPI001072C575|nr:MULTISPECIES: hypothetical protein [unclassified Brevundimonas]QBX37620.1 hypothetical protein E4M01_07445 [Brevundimonas sp. MF30-B]TFW03587.1 hypothetical protein E4M02_00375 [Brevundimonas sp. S30B]